MRNACILEDKQGAMHIRFNYDIFWAQFVETNCIFEFLSEKYPISKNNWLTRILGSEVSIILNSVFFQGFSGKSRTICAVSYFYTLVFVENLFQECYILQEEMMALVLNNIYNTTSRYGKKSGNLIYTRVSKIRLSYGGNHLTILSGCHLLRNNLKN